MATTGEWPDRSFRELDPRIRQFGYVPDWQTLLPGDVLLVDGSNILGRWIKRAQEHGGFDPEHARWTHAALYIGRGRLVEATPFGGVRIGQLAGMTFGRELLVRRRAPDLSLTMEQRYEIVVSALSGLRRGYSLDAIPRLAWHAWRQRLWEQDQRPDIGGVIICSTLVRNAYTESIYVDLLPGMIGVSWPADISVTDQLTDVPIGWARVVA